MNWDAIGAIAELLAAADVIASLPPARDGFRSCKHLRGTPDPGEHGEIPSP